MSTSAPLCPLPTSVNLGETFGSLLGGIFLGSIFYGANCLQIFIYFVNYPKDKSSLKFLVVCLWLFDSIHQILSSVGIWQYLVANFGNYTFLGETHIPSLAALAFSAVVSTIVQLFLIYRIWHLSGKKFIFPALLIPASLGQLILLCIYTGKTIADHSSTAVVKLNLYATVWGALTAATDVSIALITCFFLARRRAGFNKRTDAMLLRLIILSVNSGLWTGIFALVMVIVSEAMPGTLIYSWFQFSISPLYCNTLLACLNARDYVRNGLHEEVFSSIQMGPTSTSREQRSEQPVVAIKAQDFIDSGSNSDARSYSSRKQWLGGLNASAN
ncbi:hypothetical protein BJ138DRAFT_1163693 [Hygrophoropsis aurantiaca]|uniref:Uncharacterized protein n=1 Tax=Hygrophoropsis aurantiaca TaxID=72124 RepID=A0ACB7ZYM3_9AGAM|nr:hypothetical protein BJ138DRAFT_1163693 [Hygrophoropsis aurantiaca]